MTAVVASGAGELLTDEEHRQVQAKADRDEPAVTETVHRERVQEDVGRSSGSGRPPPRPGVSVAWSDAVNPQE
jgi:hypothetical protein